MVAALTITGNVNDALAAIAKLERGFDAMENRMKRVTRASNEPDGFAKMTQNAASFAQQLTGVASAVDLIFKGIRAANVEWQDFVDRQAKALGSNQSYAKSLETLAFNAAGDQKYDSLAKVEELVSKISKETGVGVNEVARALSNASSAKGAMDLQAAADAVTSVLKFVPNSPEIQNVMAGAALDIRKHEQGATPADAIGFTQMLGQAARIEDPAQVAANAVPAAILMSKIDHGNLHENAAVYAAITQTAGDNTGRRSRTGGIALALQLEQALPEMKDTLSRVRFMQENPDAAKAFLEGGKHGGREFKGLDMQLTGPNGEDITFGTDRASFEKNIIPAIRDLFVKDSATAKTLDSALSSIPRIQEGRKVFDQKLEELSQSPTMQAVDRDRRLKSAAERTRIRDTAAANDAAVRQGFEENMSAEGIGYLHRQEASWGKFFREAAGQSSEEAAVNTSRAMENAYRSRNNPELARRFGEVGGTFEESQQVAEVFRSTGAGSSSSNPDKRQVRNALNTIDSHEMFKTGDSSNVTGLTAEESALEQQLARRMIDERRKAPEDRDQKLLDELKRQTDHLYDIKVGRAKRPLNPNGNTEQR